MAPQIYQSTKKTVLLAYHTWMLWAILYESEFKMIRYITLCVSMCNKLLNQFEPLMDKCHIQSKDAYTSSFVCEVSKILNDRQTMGNHAGLMHGGM